MWLYHTWYLSFFVRQRIWKLYAKKVRKFTTKIASRQNSVNNLVFWSAYMVFFISGWRIWCFGWHTWCFGWRIWCFGWRISDSKQSLLFSLWKKVRRVEKSTPTPLVRCWLISGMGFTDHKDLNSCKIIKLWVGADFQSCIMRKWVWKGNKMFANYNCCTLLILMQSNNTLPPWQKQC